MNLLNSRSLSAIALAILFCCSAAEAQTFHWDVNNSFPGASIGGFADGIWDTSTPNWSVDPDGEALTEPWIDGAHAVFSAGTDAFDSAITFSGPRTVGSMTIQDGLVAFFGPAGSIAIGPNPVRVEQGATLQIVNQNLISTAPG